MDDFGTLARAHTTLTAVQQEFLKRLLVLFPFLADLAHARVRLYLQTKDRKAFVIAAQEWPRTVYLPPDGTAEGRVIKCLTVVDDATHEAVAVIPERAIGE